MYVGDSRVAGDLTNVGSMTISSFDGITTRSGAEIQGSIENQAGGSIEAGDDGMEIRATTIGTATDAASGNLVNAGTIRTGSDSGSVGDGIVITDTSIVYGDIVNSAGGLIDATNAGGDDGIDLLDKSVVHGSIENAGTIRTSRSTGDAINVSGGARVHGGIENTATGVIESGDEGIQVLGTEIGNTTNAASGNIVNAGRIEVASDGVLISAGGTVRGDIRNAAGGLIDSATRGGDDAIDLRNSTLGGRIENAGSIDAAGDGIVLYGSTTVAGEIRNTATGVIDAAEDGIDIEAGTTASGGLRNDGTLTAAASAIAVDGAVGAATGTGIGIHNTGSLQGDGAAISVATGASVAGGITNSGSISGSLMLFGSDGSGGGIDVTNTGSIDLGTSQSHISGGFSQPGSVLAITLLSFGDYTAAPLTILGDAAIAGELLLGFDPGFVFSPQSRFTLIDILGGRTGSFVNYGDDALVASFAGGDLFLDYLDGGDVELYTAARAAVPAPGSLALVGLGLLGWRLGRRGGVVRSP
jgi:hypothetical protein